MIRFLTIQERGRKSSSRKEKYVVHGNATSFSEAKNLKDLLEAKYPMAAGTICIYEVQRVL